MTKEELMKELREAFHRYKVYQPATPIASRLVDKIWAAAFRSLFDVCEELCSNACPFYLDLRGDMCTIKKELAGGGSCR